MTEFAGVRWKQAAAVGSWVSRREVAGMCANVQVGGTWTRQRLERAQKGRMDAQGKDRLSSKEDSPQCRPDFIFQPTLKLL